MVTIISHVSRADVRMKIIRMASFFIEQKHDFFN